MDLYAHFRNTGCLTHIPPGRVVLGVSGGADSVALLHLMRRLAPEKKWELRVAHVQHGLRGKASERDQAFVENLAGRFGLRFEAIAVPVEQFRREQKHGVENAARILRYRALGDAARRLRARTICVAHNAGDQAETFFLNLLRGSGLDGLAAMPALRPLREITGRARDAAQLARPLLAFERAEIERYLREQRLKFRTDASNRSTQFRRNWLRLELFPLLQTRQPKLTAKIAALTQLLQTERAWIDAEIARMSERVYDGKFLALPKFFRYNEAAQRCFLHRLFRDSSQAEIEQIHQRLLQAKGAQTFPLQTKKLSRKITGSRLTHEK